MGKVIILETTTKNPISLIGERAGICYGTNVTNKEKNYKRGMDCILSMHGRTLEFVNVEMILDGYSARVMREYYTHIGGTPTRLQASTRYIDYNDFSYVIPHKIAANKDTKEKYEELMKEISKICTLMEKDYGISREDTSMMLPLSMTTKIVDKRNLRNWIDMSHQRMCTRAYWEYRELFNDICKALRSVSDEWKWIVDNLFIPKCEYLGYCPEKKSCGRRSKKEEDN